MGNTRKNNAPVGSCRAELVVVTKDHEIKLSGSPIEYSVHADYQTGDHRTGLTATLGIAGIYNHTDGGYETQGDISSVSDDGFTITLDGTDGVNAGDLVEVIYYSSSSGTNDHQTPTQVGDALTPETLDAVVQKLNDCPPLDFENAGLTFDSQLAYHTVSSPGAGATTTLVKYAATQVGTWQTSDTPFYVTSVTVAWAGADTHPEQAIIKIKVDGGTEESMYPLSDFQHIMNPADHTNISEYTFINLGLVECESEFQVRIGIPASDFAPDDVWCYVQGWHS